MKLGRQGYLEREEGHEGEERKPLIQGILDLRWMSSRLMRLTLRGCGQFKCIIMLMNTFAMMRDIPIISFMFECITNTLQIY